MPFALLVAFAGSLAIHAVALFVPDVDLSTVPEPTPLRAELQIPKKPEVAAEPARLPVVRPAPPRRPAPAARASEPVAALPIPPAPAGETPQAREPASPPAPKVAEAQLPAHGGIRFVVYRGDQQLEIGRAQHEWEFNADGTYRLRIITETTGLAALIKPIRLELESRGKFVAGGLQPARFSTLRNGAETDENADFDWAARQVTLTRGNKRFDLEEGAQDLVSFHYQLVFVPQLADGATIGVANGKKFERYHFASLGEETLETPAGSFRTLHVRVQTDSTTDIWLALDRKLLPVKIRHADRKGESFETVAVDLGKTE